MAVDMLHEPPGDVNGTVGMFQWFNSVTDNFFFPGMILAVWIIIFVKQLTNPGNSPGKCFASASFICFILSTFARVMNFVPTFFIVIFIILTGIGAVWMHKEES